ncbi:carboxylic ester hydrolase-18 [Coleophoma cylindrospora]|uniref:Carboxylic ester hydrolase n=1 Tax=Coleophoma cylindrospora TaxID=1849047 RepID=A0A3D8RLT5_9HELO|nr:carboxylic ester hydrolase-18 [Coleophoma cylindrospora]
MQFFTVFTALSLPLAWAAPHFQHKRSNFTIGQIVETSSGPVAGHASTTHLEVSEYLGIPYARPPVGDLRFAAPLKFDGRSMLNGSAFGNSCPIMQSSGSAPTDAQIAFSNITDVGLELITTILSPAVVYSEDCLYLNVWTKPQSGERQKAVMVYIYGGGFTGGTSSIPVFDGATLADKEDLVIVTFNYRLSILGWPGNPAAQNNVAFLDQRLAMEWVRDNIVAFGGDPTRITLFGQSAGAASIDFYSYAWSSDPIAAGIILQSGTTGLYPANSESVSAAAWYNISDALGCGNALTDSVALLECMRNVDVDSLLEAIPRTGLNAIVSAFGPTIDNALVFSDYSKQTPANIPVLVGNNDYESGLFRTQLALSGTAFPDWVWNAYDLAGYTCPSGVRANASLLASNPTWRYRYFGVFPNINISSEGGAWHGAELQLIFGTTDLTGNDTVMEFALEEYLQGAWTTFAKDPVNGLTTYEGGWPLYNPAEETLIRLGYDNVVGKHLASPTLYDTECANATITALIASFFG